MTCDQVADEMDSYVLGALNGPEKGELERHVASCANCSADMQRARTAADLLAIAARPFTPSPRVKARLLERARQDRPFAVTTSQRRPAWLPWPGLAALGRAMLAPAALLLVVASLWWTITLQQQVNRLDANLAQAQAMLSQNKQAVDIMSTPGAGERELAPTAVAPTAWAQLYVSPSATQAALVTRDLPALPGDRVYQVWLIDGNGVRTSGGLFSSNGSGSDIVIVQAPLPFSSYRGIGITVEPKGGSAGPTGSRVLGGNL